MRTVEGAGREGSEPLEFLEDVERSVHHQDPGQCIELRSIGLTTYNWSMFHALVLFIPDSRLTEVEQPRERKKKSSSHQPRALLFPVYRFNSESSVDSRQTARLLCCRSSQLGHRDRSNKGRPCRDREFILQPKAYETVRPQRYLGP